MSVKGIRIIDENVQAGAGGAGSDPADLYAALGQEELNALSSKIPNQIIDSFDTERGTKSQLIVSADALRFDPGYDSGSYNRKLIGSAPSASVTGLAVHTAQALAPKNGQTLDTSTSQDIIFSGDVQNLFQLNKNVLISELYADTDSYADDQTRESFLNDSSGNIAELEVTAISYDGLNDETTITVANPDGLDLSLAISTSLINSRYRVTPWDYQYQVRSDSGQSLETMPIADAFIEDIIRIQGESPQMTLDASLAPSQEETLVKFSENKQYGVMWTRTNDSGNDVWRWYYSVDYGRSFAALGTVVSGFTATNIGSLESSLYNSNSGQAFISNDGKFFGIYENHNGSGNNGVYGVYSDLSVGSPTLSNTPDTGDGGATPTTGRIFSDTATNTYAVVDGDPVDGSFIVVAIVSAANDGYIRCFSSGGSVYESGSSFSYSGINATGEHYVKVTGSSGSHRIHYVRKDTSPGDIDYNYSDEGTGSWTGSIGNIFGGNARNLIDFKIAGTWGYVLVDTGSGGDYYIGRIQDILTSPSNAGNRRLMDSGSGVGSSHNIGFYEDTNSDNFFASYGRALQVNPTDPDHVFVVLETHHSNNSPYAHFMEIKDINTDWKGLEIQYYSTTTNETFRINTNTTLAGQTFTGSSTRVRAVGLWLYQVGKIADGSLITMDIYATSGGVPTGSPIASSLNSIDASKVTTSSAGQWFYWTFDDPALDSLTGVYACVMNASFTIDGSNYISMKGNNGSGYANGTLVRYNGSTWSTNINDLSFEIYGEWHEILHAGEDSGISFNGETNHIAAPQIEFIDSNSIRFVSRYVPVANTTYRYNEAGHPYWRTITIGSSNKSTITDLSVVGFQDEYHDPNLSFAVSFGGEDSAESLNVNTGVESNTNLRIADRSGCQNDRVTALGHTYVASAPDFQSGHSMSYNGSTDYTSYADVQSTNFDPKRDFAVEAEIIVNNYSGYPEICSKGTSATNRWQLAISNTGQVDFFASDGSSYNTTSTAGDIATGTYYVVRAVYSNVTKKFKLYKSTDRVNYTELTLTVDNTYGSSLIGSGGNFHVGRRADVAGNYWNGELGYLKIAKGWGLPATGFKYNGFVNQAGLSMHLNCGHMVTARKALGLNSSTSIDSPYFQSTFMNPDASQASVRDSYDVIAQFNYSISGTAGKELELNLLAARGNIRDQSSIQGINFRFNK